MTPVDAYSRIRSWGRRQWVYNSVKFFFQNLLMSMITAQDHPPVLQRCVLSVPAINPRMFDKALASEADYIMLDCEDSVAAADKQQARTNVIKAVQEIDWRAGGKTLMVRINGPDTHFMYRDLIDIVEAGGQGIHSIMLPKASTVSDIYMLDCLLGQLEMNMGIKHRIAIEALIETAAGAMNVKEIASASLRLQALHFGAGDFAASCGARTTNIGGLNPDFPGDPWHPVLQSIVIACRANGIRPVDSAYGDISDSEGYLLAARRAAALGYSGKWAIHPSQIALANKVMTPPVEEVLQARRILEAMEHAAGQGQGAASIDGKMIDVASIRMAKNIVVLNQMIVDKT